MLSCCFDFVAHAVLLLLCPRPVLTLADSRLCCQPALLAPLQKLTARTHLVQPLLRSTSRPPTSQALRRESEDTEDQIVEQIKEFVASFAQHLDIITKFYADNNLDPKG